MTTTARHEDAEVGSPQADATSPRARAPAALLPHRPYPGLRPFEKAEWPIFQGRDRLIQDILAILAKSHFASIIGPSGSGKSSLVRAGVLATLERRHSRMGIQWRTGVMRPGASPLWSMADGILRALRPDLTAANGEVPAAEVARVRVLMDSNQDGLAAGLRKVGLKQDENLLLLVDQFEEIFRFRSEAANREQKRLVELLVAMAQARPPGLYIVTTMRSEYLGDCARFDDLADTLNETHYLLPRMTEDELRQAIARPAEIKGGHIEPALIDRLISDIAGQEDQLPILQHTLLWMWIQEEEKQRKAGLGNDASIRIRLADYEQLRVGRKAGGADVKNALSRHGDKILDDMSREQRIVAEVMFRRMVEIEEHSNRLRRPTRCGTVARLAQVSLDVVQGVVDAFRADDASFVVVGQPAITDDTSVDITHESLIRQWDTLDRWVRREKASYEVYDELCRAAQGMKEGRRSLLTGLELSRALLWASKEQPTRLWARRYGGDFNAAIDFLTESEEAEEQRQREKEEAEEAARRGEEERLQLENERLRLEEEQSRLRAEKSLLEQDALRTSLKEQTRLARERRRFTRLAVAGVILLGIVSAFAVVGFVQARAEAVRAEAASFWHRLKLFGDSLEPDAVTALWDLTQQDEEIRVAFVQQLTENRELLQQFGFKPAPIARAIGLRWPDQAREVGKQSVAHVASDRFDPNKANLFELISYTRALAALRPWLDPAMADAATQKIASAIDALAGHRPLSDRQLWVLAEVVGVFAERVDPAAIERAREQLRQEIVAPSADNTGRRARATSRAIEVMAPVLTAEERLQAVRSMAPLLGQDMDSWSATAIPRALLVLAPFIDADRADAIQDALPSAIAKAAVSTGTRDSSYLLTLMRLDEAIAGLGDEMVADLGRALAEQIALPNEPLQRAALARASVPVLVRLGESAEGLRKTVLDVALVPQGTALDPVARSYLRQKGWRDATAAWEQVLASLGEEPKGVEPLLALEILHAEWSTQPGRSNPYRLAAQARLIEMLAPKLSPPSAGLASSDLLALLADVDDYVAREAIARALAALAPALPEPDRRAARSAARLALAKSGFAEEATAWAGAIAALLPSDSRDATAETVEALKYPTATGAASEALLEGLAKHWPGQFEAIVDRTLPDPIVTDWLQERLPDGFELTDPPLLPDGFKPIDPALSEEPDAAQTVLEPQRTGSGAAGSSP